MGKVLLIDDDIELCQILTARMEGEGFELNASHDGARGLELAISGENSLIVLELMLPGLSGLEVLRRVRDRTNVPVLILTARGEEVDRILGLELGADDYVSKPFNVRELIARMRAILRRTGNTTRGTADYVAGDIRLVPAAREVWVQDRRISLTGTEFTLLQLLLERSGQTLSLEELTEVVLGRKLGTFDHAIDVHVSNSAPGRRMRRIAPPSGAFVIANSP